MEKNRENYRLHNLENVAIELKFQSAFHISTSKLSIINFTFCSYLNIEENTCFGVLKEFPQRLLQTFDELGTKTRTKICQTQFVRRTDLITMVCFDQACQTAWVQISQFQAIYIYIYIYIYIDSHFKNRNLIKNHHQYLATRQSCTFCWSQCQHPRACQRKVFAAFVIHSSMHALIVLQCGL